MTIRAQNSQVGARQRKTRFLVTSKGKTRGLETLQVVTRFATILVRRSGKLAFVNILVTVLALHVRDFK